MDFHRLTCEVVQLVNDCPKKMQKFANPLGLHVKGLKWSMTFLKKLQNFPFFINPLKKN
jgi:type IV secretory pathway TrbF-like protein